MGYRTDYVLTVTGLDADMFEKVDDAIRSVNNYFINENMVDGCASWTDYNDTWYDHEKDIAGVSAKYPQMLFKLWGSGEDYEDLWYEYFKAGKVQRAPAEIRYPDFDEALLEPLECSYI